jgi:cyanate lyase
MLALAVVPVRTTFPTDRKGIAMQQSNVTQDARQALTARIIAGKALKDLSWAQLAEGTGHSVPYVTAALLGQHALGKEAAAAVAKQLDLNVVDTLELQSIPLRGSIAGGIPTDPTIYRFHEMIQVYGTTLKALVHEQFGDGIISAINFKLDIKKVDDPEGGSRAVITLDGKFLPYKPF